MANFVFNTALGRTLQLHKNAGGSPVNAALVLVVLKATGISTDAALKDLTSLSAVLAHGTTDEATNTGYARKTFQGAATGTETIDNTADAAILPLPSVTWTAVGATGGAWAKLLVCYDGDVTTGTDANIIPVTAHDLVVTPSGGDITVTGSSGYCRIT